MVPVVEVNGRASPRKSSRPGVRSAPMRNSPCEEMTGASAKRPFQSNVSSSGLRAVKWKSPPSGVVLKSLSEKATGANSRVNGLRRAERSA
jgi:hypothetical protein